jgi:hypothetical protein
MYYIETKEHTQNSTRAGEKKMCVVFYNVLSRIDCLELQIQLSEQYCKTLNYVYSRTGV